jgi:hypothetical protein
MPKQPTKRCLRCRQPFVTRDPRRNHVCPTCTKINNELSPGYAGLDFYEADGPETRRNIGQSDDWHGSSGQD